jgi:hypothetical protein
MVVQKYSSAELNLSIISPLKNCWAAEQGKKIRKLQELAPGDQQNHIDRRYSQGGVTGDKSLHSLFNVQVVYDLGPHNSVNHKIILE